MWFNVHVPHHKKVVQCFDPSLIQSQMPGSLVPLDCYSLCLGYYVMCSVLPGPQIGIDLVVVGHVYWDWAFVIWFALCLLHHMPANRIITMNYHNDYHNSKSSIKRRIRFENTPHRCISCSYITESISPGDFPGEFTSRGGKILVCAIFENEATPHP